MISRFLLGSAALMLFAACSQEVPTDKIPEPTGQDEEELAPRPEPTEARGHFRRGGPAFLLKKALRELDLRPEQEKTIQALMADLGQGDSPAQRDFGKALAEGVRAGKLDDTALEPHFAALEKSRGEHRQEVHTALNTLHRTLDAEQRKQLVQSVGALEGDGKCGGEGRHRGSGFGMLNGLDLSDAQREKLRENAIERDMKPGEPMRALLAAFAGERFDANALAAPSAREMARARVKHLQALLAVLEPAQREKLAARIEAGPGKRKH